MSQPPPLAPVPPLTPNNSKKRNASQSGMSNNLNVQPLKKYKPTPQQYQYYQHPNQHPHQQYYTPNHQSYPVPPNNTHSYDMRQSTKQYYDNPKRIKKSPTPQIIQPETICISNNNNTFPNRILEKLSDREKIMLDIGTCSGLLFGQIEMQKEAQPGDITITYRRAENNNKPIISISNSENIYLGQGDTKLVTLFSNFMHNKRLQLTGKIIDANLDIYKKRLPPNRFIRKLLINVSCEYNIIQSLIERSNKKIKNWKWIKPTICLEYFEGKTIEYNKLYDFIMDSISENNMNTTANILSLEANFNATFADDITAEDLDGIDPYEEIVCTKLLQHQRIGIEWMMIRENGIDNDNNDEYDEQIPPFYKEIEDKETGDIKYINLLNDEECDDLPELGCGGILADDMGLGKTLQCISLIASNSNYQNDSEYGCGPTLIVAPLTVIGNWVSQITDHCNKGSFKIMIYHGPNREKDLDIIKLYNIVITTYDIVALEFADENDENREEMRKHYGCGLQYVNWLRVVLDEAHKIRSRKTRVFKACNALVSKSRWCLTGTPVQNRLDDLYSLFCFLKLQPICDKNFWHKFIIGPLKNSNAVGFERLRKIMKQLCLRRDKHMKINGKPIISIPDKVVKTRVLTFISEEKDKYLKLMSFHKAAFNKMRKRGDKEIMRNFSSVLSMLLRLRQCCAHPLLVPELNDSSIDLDNIVLNNDIDDISSNECTSCGMMPDEAILTNCKHIYCKDCYLYELEINNGIFPCTLCGDKLTNKSILREINSQPKDDNNTNNQQEQKDNNEKKKPKKKYKKFQIPTGIKIEPSTKMRSLIADVKSWNGTEVGGAPNKAVVFSQWTSVLDILAVCLDNEEILYERLDGSMSRSTREAAMDNFRQQLDIPVFLMSLKAGNLGVNMTSANHVYMLDPWWNPAAEDQAVDRVYRLGQKRIVHVNHFVIKDSVEEKILKIQTRKRKLIASALGQSKEDLKQARKKEWLNDLKELFTAK